MIATPTFPDLSALVVDESLYIRRIVRDMLMRVGIKRVLEAPDGAEALGVLAESKPDISIIDWDLSILSGEEFIRLARTPTTSPCPTIPIILMLAQPRRNVVDRAVALGVKTINAESAGELERIAAAARRHGTVAPVALRVNPDIASGSHPHISTGLGTHKFGVPLSEARAIVRDAAAHAELRFAGLHVHIGSQMVGLDPLRRAATAVIGLAQELRDDGISVEHLDLGGGLGIVYDDEPVPPIEVYAAALVDIVRPSGLTVVVELGPPARCWPPWLTSSHGATAPGSWSSMRG